MIKIVNSIDQANCITHSGTMHADEVFSTAFLELYLDDIKVYRTNNVEFDKLREDAIVYDVGRGKFDHHQINPAKRENGIIYCAFGLLWNEFGHDFLNKFGVDNVDEVFKGIEKDLIEAIDADDNGQFPKIEANYKVKTVSGIIKLFNPSFDSDETESEQFIKAVGLAKEILTEEILYINGKVKSDKQIKELLNDITEEDKVLILDKFLPYEETILLDERANNLLYVAFPSNRGGYAIKTIPKSIDDHTARLPFPEEWGGLEKEELEEKSGIKGLLFCHTGRFIVNCKDIDVVYNVIEKICK